MKRFNVMLLATIASSAMATAAYGQSLPAPTDTYLRGAGATSIQNVVVQETNCIGDHQQLGVSTGALSTVPEMNFASPPYSVAFNCDETAAGGREIQHNFAARYIATGSGFGRQAWRLNSYQFSATVQNPFVNNALDTTASWSHVQFAFSDGGAAPSDIQAYNNATTGASTFGGKPIQFPKYVLPVGVAYDPVYGRDTNPLAPQDFTFRVTSPRTINGVAAGGLRMSRDTYCKVFNGAIVNFNDAAFTADNGGTSLRDVDDSTTRWNADGVPVRLVGRMDRSGTTDIFTRALAAQCNISGLTNKYAVNAETLPYDRTPGANVPDYKNVRADTGASPSSTQPVAGTTNSIGNQYYDGTGIVTLTPPAGSQTGLPSNPTGAAGSGLYLLADGSGRVRDAIRFAPDYASPTASNVLLNGKIGYIGSDFIAGSDSAASAPLFAAALQNPNVSATTWVMPEGPQATSAFGSITPPESDSAGAWQTGDTRLVRNPAGGANIAATRTNPLAWYDVMYAAGSTLADPGAGYPITGTVQFLGHQCYATNNRRNMVEFIGHNLGVYSNDENGAALPQNANMFIGIGGTTPGLLDRSNIGAVPLAWRNAISQTFLRNSTQVDAAGGSTALGTLNLWIQNSPSRAATTTTNATVCTGLAGA